MATPRTPSAPSAKRASRTKTGPTPRRRQHSAPLSPEVAWYMESRGFPIPTTVPKFRTPEPRNVRGAKFDPAKVDAVIFALGLLQHTQGKWFGKPLKPSPWQVAHIIAPVFGWVRWVADAGPEGTGAWLRIIRNVWIDICRKNGKTTLMSALALIAAFADKEPGAQVVMVAASRDQIENAYRPAKILAEFSPALKSAGIVATKNYITGPDGSFVRAAASRGDLLQGSNVYMGVGDEIHTHKTRDVIDAVEKGMGAREQPLMLLISTTDDGSTNTLYSERREEAEKLARGVLKNPAKFAVIFAADDDCDPWDERSWADANPGLGTSPTMEFMRSEAEAARSSTVALNSFKRYHLGIRVREKARFLDMPSWKRNAGLVDAQALLGKTFWGGLDLASRSDLASWCMAFPHEHDEGYDVIWRHYTPEENLKTLAERTNGSAYEWAKQGWITTTPGNVMDYERILKDIRKDCADYDCAALGFDKHDATMMVNKLAEDDIPLIEVPQTTTNLSVPTKELQRLVLKGSAEAPLVVHGGNPVMIWQADNLIVIQDTNENIKPDKNKSHEKIDGMAAFINALSLHIREEAEAFDPYADRGVMSV